MRKTKHKKLAFTLSMMVYPSDLRVSFGETDEEVKKWLSKSIPDEVESQIWHYETECSPARCVMFEDLTGLIRMRKVPSDPVGLSALQHEITHYVYFLLGHSFHMPHNEDTTEAYAYLTGYITCEIYSQINGR